MSTQTTMLTRFPVTSGVKKKTLYVVVTYTTWVLSRLADHCGASLAPRVLEFFVIQLFGAATLCIEGREASV